MGYLLELVCSSILVMLNMDLSYGTLDFKEAFNRLYMIFYHGVTSGILRLEIMFLNFHLWYNLFHSSEPSYAPLSEIPKILSVSQLKHVTPCYSSSFFWYFTFVPSSNFIALWKVSVAFCYHFFYSFWRTWPKY